mgnify:CR=1
MNKLTVAFIIIGLLVFTSLAAFHVDGWIRLYAFWDKIKDVLLLSIIVDLSKKRYGNLFKPVFELLLIRLLWECVSAVTGLNINNSVAVGVLFIIYILYVLRQTIKNVRG